MKVLIGINPKGHIHLATDEQDGLNKAGMECRSIRYGRKDYSVKGPAARLLDTVLNSFNIISTLYKMHSDILYLNSRLEPIASVRDFITLFLIKCFYYKKLKVVIKSHGSDLSVMESKSILYKSIVIPYLTRHVDLWLFLSSEEKEAVSKYKKRMAEKISITCNIIEPSRHISNTTFKNKYDLDHDKMKILFIGRVVYEKGVFDFLKAIPMVDNKDICDFILVGDGEDLNKVKQLAEDIGVTPYIRFLGWVEQGEAENFYGSVDILVYPTFYGEGFPMVIFKGVASGLAIVTTKIRAALDHLKMPENVLWVEPKNENQIANAINELVRDAELRQNMGINNKRLGTQFSRDKICDEMTEAFAALMTEKSIMNKKGTYVHS